MKSIDEIARSYASKVNNPDYFEFTNEELIKKALSEATKELQEDKERLDWLQRCSWFHGVEPRDITECDDIRRRIDIFMKRTAAMKRFWCKHIVYRGFGGIEDNQFSKGWWLLRKDGNATFYGVVFRSWNVCPLCGTPRPKTRKKQEKI